MPRGVPKAGFRKTKKRIQAIEPKMYELETMPVTTESDIEIAKKLKERFEILEDLTNAAIEGAVKSVIVSGPPGLGKSYTVEQALEAWDPDEKHHTVIRGYVKGTGLFKTLWQFRRPGQVIVFDDSDSLFMDDTTLGMLKAVCDSTEKRRVSYLAEFNMIDETDASVIPRTFVFDGTIIFISNLDFDAVAAKGGKLAPHLGAMISRSHYIDLAMKSRRDYLIRIRQVLKLGLLKKRGLDASQERQVMRFIEKNQDNLREMSLRIAIKLGDLLKRNPSKFEKMAQVTCCKNS